MNNSMLEQWRSITTEDKILTKELAQKDKCLADAFTTRMEFGTDGICGIMGAGTNKVNIHTVAAAAKAYAQFLIKNVKGAKTKGVIVGHDNRDNSALFAKTVANVLLNNGIKAYLFEGNELQPAPLISYVIRKMKLAGGAVVTSSYDSKEYNGFKVYNQLGGQLMPQYTKTIQENMAKLDVLKIEKETDKEIRYIPSTIIDAYVKDLLDKVQLRSDAKNIKVAFSPLHGTTGTLAPKILDEMGVEHYEVEKQLQTRGDFKYAKSSNPEEAKAYNKVVNLARRKKADLAIVTDPDGDRFGAVVKYQKRYKYLNGNQMAALYLDYKLTQLKASKKLPKDGYIVKTVVSGNLPAKIAEKFGIKVVETHAGFKNIAEVMEHTSGTFIMGYEESYGFALDKTLTREKDSLQVLIGFVEMINYYKSNDINVFEHLKELWTQYGIHRTVQNSMKIDATMANRLMKNIQKLKSISGHKIISKMDYRKKNDSGLDKATLVKLILDNGSWIAIMPSGTEPKVKVYIQTVGDHTQEIIDVVVFEKEIESIVEENSESYPEKNISKKTVFKYLAFLAIMIVTIYLVFRLIYDGATTKGDTFKVAKEIFTSNTRWIFLIGFVAYFFPVFLHAFQKKRLISAFGQKVKWRHLAVSAFMGSFVSWITPFAIGGDAIGYWFLRRKGFKRGPLASSFLTGTIIYQFQIVLVSAILLPMGIVMFHDEIFNGSAEMRTIITLFIIGACWNLFATFMIYMLTFNKRFQEWIVRTTIKLLEWLPFVHIQDPGRLASTYQFMFYDIRIGMKTIFKRKMLLLECTFYETVTSFVSFGMLIPILLGLVRPDLMYGDYFSLIVGSDVANTANSYSITPGGSGTGEYIGMVINRNLYTPVNGIGNSAATATALDLLSKLTSWWPILLGSFISIIVVIAGEKRVKKYKIINNNNRLKNIENVQKTTFYKKVSPLLVCLVLGFLLGFFLIFI